MGLSWETRTEEVKRNLKASLDNVDYHSSFELGLTKIWDLGLELAEGSVPKSLLDILFGSPNTWERVAESDDDSDYNWDLWVVYKVTIPTWNYSAEAGDRKRDLVFHVKFEGYGRSHGDSDFKGWSFVEPKTKTVEVWE